MEPETKRRRLSTTANSKKAEMQWQKCGDGFDDFFLDTPKSNVLGTKRNSRRLYRPPLDKRKSLSDVFLKDVTNQTRTLQHMIDHYSSDEDSDTHHAKQGRSNADVDIVSRREEVSQLSSTLPSIEDVESSADVLEQMQAKHDLAEVNYMEDEISDYDDDENDLQPPSPVFGEESPAVISSCSTENSSETDSSSGGSKKTSEWVKQLKWQSKTPEKSQGISHVAQLDESGKKKKKLIKDGFADRLEKVISREKSAVRFRTHRMSAEDAAKDKSGILSVQVLSTQEDHGHLVCVCDVCMESRHLLQNGDKAKEKGDGETENPALCLILFTQAVAKQLHLVVGSTVHISPPWQKLHVPVSSAKKTTYTCVVLCTQFCKVDNGNGKPNTQTAANEPKCTTTLAVEWTCPCLQGDTITKDCPCEAQPVLPSHYNELFSSSCDNFDSTTQPRGLSVICDNASKDSSCKTLNTSILDSIERGGPTVSFTATVQRVVCQSASTGVRWSLVLQDKEGTVCEVVLPSDAEASSPHWHQLLESEGKEVQTNGLRIQQRTSYSSAPGLFSLIESLWTEEMSKKFIARKNYSQDSEELQSSTQRYKAQMAGFCYILTVSMEEGMIKPIPDSTAEVSPLYCDPHVVTLHEAVSRFTRHDHQSHRVTVYAQLVYKVHSDAGKLQDVYFVRDGSIYRQDKGYTFIKMKGTHRKTQVKTPQVYCFMDVIVDSDTLCVDGYSRIFPLDCLHHNLGSKVPSSDELRILNECDVRVPKLQSDSRPHEMVEVSGYVSGVDEDTACSWMTCARCGSDKLSGGTAQNPFVYCKVCKMGVSEPVTRMHLEVYLTDTGWEGKLTVKVQLQQETIEKLLPETVDDEGYEMSSVLNKHVGPITCILMKCSAAKNEEKLVYLEEIAISL